MSEQEPHNDRAYSVIKFCKAHNISRSMYYKLRKQGQGPKLMKVGRRRLISDESAAKWRQQMERP